MTAKQNNYNSIIKSYDTLDDIAAGALKIFVDTAEYEIKSKGFFFVAISGGSTPEKFFKLLAENDVADKLQWNKIHIFWVDERCVSPDNKASNYGSAKKIFLDKILIPEKNIHRIQGELHGHALAAQQYEQDILNAFNIEKPSLPQFDLIILGMGTDAHIASLFPGSKALDETNALVVAVPPSCSNELDRITITPPVITAAKHIVVLVSGQQKAQILNQIMNTTPDKYKYPVHMLWTVLDKVTWLIDKPAAKFLIP